MSDELMCPRRSESFASASFPGPDHWREERDSYHLGPTCDYCGSISGERLFELIAAGAEIGPTDKNYKIYVSAPNPTPDALRVNGGGSASIVEPPFPNSKRVKDLTAEERVIAERDRWTLDDPEAWVSIGPAGPRSHGKFYFQHLSEDEKRRFIDLANAKAINFGYPGHLYVKPFFATTHEVSA